MPRLRTALEVFLWSRAAIWIAMLLSYATFEARFALPLHPPVKGPEPPRDVGWGFDVWARWDGGWFTGIARDGYTDPKTTTAFFPAYPLLVRAAGWVAGGHYVLAGVIVSLLAAAAAFALLHELARKLVGDGAALRSVVYLAVFPAALFLGELPGTRTRPPGSRAGVGRNSLRPRRRRRVRVGCTVPRPVDCVGAADKAATASPWGMG